MTFRDVSLSGEIREKAGEELSEVSFPEVEFSKAPLFKVRRGRSEVRLCVVK